MNKLITVKEVMSERLVTLHPKDNITRAKEVFNEYQIHHILVCVMNEVRGIISLGDILYLQGLTTNNFDKYLQEKREYSTPVEDVMTSNPYQIGPDDLLLDALEIMTSKRVNALPVVNASGLVGIITTHDILKSFQSLLK